jgi:hypothetical protein
MFASDNDKFAKLLQLTGRYPGTSTAHKAQFEMAKIDLNAVQQLKGGGQPETAWHDRLESARTNLEAAKVQPSLSGSVENLQRQIDGLVADASPDLKPAGTAPAVSANTPPNPSKKTSKKPTIEELLKEAHDDFQADRLDDAENKARGVIEQQNDNKEAQQLLDRIEKRREWLQQINKEAGKGL